MAADSPRDPIDPVDPIDLGFADHDGHIEPATDAPADVLDGVTDDAAATDATEGEPADAAQAEQDAAAAREEHLTQLFTATVMGPGDERIGKVGQVYLDDQTQEPNWITVRTGLFGTKEYFIPLDEAHLDGKNIVVPYAKAEVTAAPATEIDQNLSPDEEDALYNHYRVPGRMTDEGAAATTLEPSETEAALVDEADGADALERDETMHDDATLLAGLATANATGLGAPLAGHAEHDEAPQPWSLTAGAEADEPSRPSVDAPEHARDEAGGGFGIESLLENAESDRGHDADDDFSAFRRPGS